MAKGHPNILLIDIETSPIQGYTWGMYEQNVLKVIAPSKIIGAAWKWLGEAGMHSRTLPDYRGYRAGQLDDQKLVEELHSILDQADVVVAHNGDSFDVKKINARFVFYGLNAPSAYKTVDTLKVAKKYFRFDANNLNAITHYLGEGGKVNTGGFDLWVKCMAGDMPAWNKMKRYNEHDVKLLERVYLRLRPFMANHPNMNLFAAPNKKLEYACPTCRSIDVQRRGTLPTRTGLYQRYQCNTCGSWSSGPYQKAKGVALR